MVAASGQPPPRLTGLAAGHLRVVEKRKKSSAPTADASGLHK
jgi:hypothetical protein